MLYNTTRLTGSPQAEDRLTLTASLVSAYVCNHTVDRPDFINLISDVYNALESLQLEADENAVQSPAVPIDESVTDDYLVCLEDGKRFKSLKRHLRAKYNMSPEDYRQRWDLPDDYPMVAPSYARKRSRLAKQMGLGRPQN